ncbi:MAG TPA: selenium metabolism-associated LysR family transcriptional regulator [Candidatus Anoxymicrobiaceae bacterium]
MGLDISLLETFTLVADLGSFSAAARSLGITQPAVSLQIKSLEKEVSARLIDRSRGKVILTPAGRTAYWHAKKILSDRELMIADIPRSTGRVAGKLLLGASTIPGEYLLPPILSEFHAIYPEVSIVLEIRDSAEVLVMLGDEQIELAFVGTEPRGEVTYQRFSQDNLVVITPLHHPLSVKQKVTLSSLTGERFVNRREGSGTRKRFEDALEQSDIGPDGFEVVAELGTNQAVISAVQAGMGISIVSRKVAEHPARAGFISLIEVTGTDLSRDFYAVNDSKRPLSVAAAAFLEMASGEK